MTTNLKIGFPDITFNALSATSDQAYSTEYPLINLVNGSRSRRAELAAEYSGTHSVTFDLGSGNTETANYIALLDVKILKASGVTTVVLKGSNGSPTTITTIDLTSITLDGENQRDYIATFAETAAYRYWIVDFVSSDPTKRPLSKALIGKLFDIGRDPLLTRRITSDRNDKQTYEKQEINLSYRGVSTTKRQEFESKIGSYIESNDITLYANSYTAVLMGKSLINCTVRDYSFTSTGAGLNDLNLNLTEVY